MLSDDKAKEYLDHLKSNGDADRVRRQIAMGQLDTRRRALAEQWLLQLERDEISEISREQRRTAKSAKNAAWAAAIAAMVAAIAAVVTLFQSPP